MNYWPADTTNLAECYEPVFDMIEDLTVTGARTAAGPVRRRRLGDAPQHRRLARAPRWSTARCWGMWQTGGAWLATLIWDHYRFTGDLDFLRRVLPGHEGRRAVLPGHPRRSIRAWATWSPTRRTRRSCSTTRRQRLRRTDHGQPDPARPVQRLRPGQRGPRRRRRLPLPGPGHPGPVAPDAGRLARQHHGVALRLGRDRTGPPARLAPLRPAPEQPDHQARQRHSSSMPPAEPSSCAATTAPAGPWPGRSTTGPAWRKAPGRTTSSASS